MKAVKTRLCKSGKEVTWKAVLKLLSENQMRSLLFWQRNPKDP
jgi:hypothetical protein